MAGSLTVTITGLNANEMEGLDAGVGNRNQVLKRLCGVINGVANGAHPGTVEIIKSTSNAVKATGTLTISSGSGSVGGTIAGTAKTVTWATDDATTAAALATAINGDATLKKYVVATAAAGVVTLTANVAGIQGNRITLTASGTGVTASNALLGGGTGTPGAGADAAPVIHPFA